MVRTLLITVLLAVAAAGSQARAESAVRPVDDGNIHIQSDRMSRSEAADVYHADGHVVVTWQDMTLTADTVDYAAQDRRMRAAGSVVMTRGTAVLTGSTLVLDTVTGRTEVDGSRLTTPETGVTMTSGKLVRISENQFTATTTELTTCDMPSPGWKFGADQLYVNTDGYATGRNVIFYIKDVPVLYLPWIAFPVVLEKRSGLLFPRFSKSTSRGYQFDLPLYWVISPSQDVLFDLDIMSRRGVGTGFDYRYLRNRGSEGHVAGYSLYDTLEQRWRWQINQEHKELFSADANVRMAVNASGDRAFAADFGEKSGDYNKQANTTVVNALKTWPHYAVNGYLAYSENLYTADNRATVQTLPEIGVAGVRQPLAGSWLFFDLDSSLANLYQDRAPSGQRAQLFPRLTVYPLASDLIKTELSTGVHLRAYNTERPDTGTTHSDADLVPDSSLRVTSAVSRVYETGFDHLKKLRHELVPEVRYDYTPALDQQHLPFYDYADRFIHRNTVSVALTSLLSGRFVTQGITEYRELSRVRVEARYSLAGERRDLLSPVPDQHDWSDLILESDTWLQKNLRVRFDARYDWYRHDLSSVATGFDYSSGAGNSIGASYQLARDTVEYFEGRLATKLLVPFILSYTARYSFDRSDFLESVYSAEYRHKCWSVSAAIHQRPGDQSYTVNFNLAGLGGT